MLMTVNENEITEYSEERDDAERTDESDDSAEIANHKTINSWLAATLSALFSIAEGVVRDAAEKSTMSEVDFALEVTQMNLPHLEEHLVHSCILELMAGRTDYAQVNIQRDEIERKMHRSLNEIVSGETANDEQEGDLHISSEAFQLLQLQLRQTVQRRLIVLSAQIKRSMHQRLSERELRFIHACDVRIMGEVRQDGCYQQGDGNDLKRDIAIFQLLEAQSLKWKHQMQNALKKKKRGKDPNTLPGVTKSLDTFATEGGHIDQLSVAQILTMHTHGLILFLVHRTEDGNEVVVGTVSGLFGAPNSEDGNAEMGSPEAEFPHLDVSTLALDDQQVNMWRNRAARTLTVVRTTIPLKIDQETFAGQEHGEELVHEYEGMALHRLGLASFGKYVLNKVAIAIAMDFFLSRIGKIVSSSTLTKTFNIPSVLLNRPLAEPLADSRQWNEITGDECKSAPVVDFGKKRHKPPFVMMWKWFAGRLSDAVAELMRRDGILLGKGWDKERLEEAAQRISRPIVSARLAQWVAAAQRNQTSSESDE